jgi:hypothetical protein
MSKPPTFENRYCTNSQCQKTTKHKNEGAACSCLRCGTPKVRVRCLPQPALAEN